MDRNEFPTEQWARWARDFIALRTSLMDLATKRALHRAHMVALEKWQEDDGTGVVHQWMVENYADSMLIGLRRLVDKTRGVLSLVKLLEAIAQNHAAFSITRYLEFWQCTYPGINVARARFAYARFSRDGRTFDQEQVRADLRKLEEDHEDILAHIDAVVAHREHPSRDELREDFKSGPRPELTWQHLDRLFDDIGALFNKYNPLVDPGAYIDFERVLPAGYEQAFIRMLAPSQRRDRD